MGGWGQKKKKNGGWGSKRKEKKMGGGGKKTVPPIWTFCWNSPEFGGQAKKLMGATLTWESF
jgi:hypothetical protein